MGPSERPAITARADEWMPAVPALGNAEVAEILDRVATLLHGQGAAEGRVLAWRRAAERVRGLERSVIDLARTQGAPALDALPDIGPSLAAAIEEIARTGRLRFLAHLEGDVHADAALASLPGIGPALARRVAGVLDVHTLEELELAAHDGRLERVRGFGPRRARAVRDSLEAMLRGTARRRLAVGRERPDVSLLLEIDARYLAMAAEDQLPKIAPRRFNPTHEAWLPILHVERDGWHFTALFSNTARAHDLGTTRDWVVIYAEKEGREVQHTVVTETHGPLAGHRVVRGREHEQIVPMSSAPMRTKGTSRP